MKLYELRNICSYSKLLFFFILPLTIMCLALEIIIRITPTSWCGYVSVLLT